MTTIISDKAVVPVGQPPPVGQGQFSHYSRVRKMRKIGLHLEKPVLLLVVGVNDSKKLLEDIPNKIVNYMGLVVDVNLYEQNGLDYIELIVNPSNVPISFKGKYYYRSLYGKHSSRPRNRNIADTMFKAGFIDT